MTGATQAQASDRFIDAFNAIDRLLRQRFKIDRAKPFYAAVEIAASVDKSIKRYELDLKEYADLRNAIIHERTDGHAIAEPHASTVEGLDSVLYNRTQVRGAQWVRYEDGLRRRGGRPRHLTILGKILGKIGGGEIGGGE